MDVDAELDRLYQASLGAFVAERNQIARTLRDAGQREEAKTVGALPRPTPVAWLVNQLHYRDPATLDELREAGVALREIQEKLGDTVAFASRKRAHQHALRAAVDRAFELGQASGVKATAALKQRLERTLNHLSAAGDDLSPAPGRMAVELEPVGFDALEVDPSARARPAAAPEPKTTTAQERKAVAAANAALEAAERELAELEKESRSTLERYERASRASEEAERAAESARRARNEARAEMEEVKTRVEAARSDVAQKRRARERTEA